MVRLGILFYRGTSPLYTSCMEKRKKFGKKSIIAHGLRGLKDEKGGWGVVNVYFIERGDRRQCQKANILKVFGWGSRGRGNHHREKRGFIIKIASRNVR